MTKIDQPCWVLTRACRAVPFSVIPHYASPGAAGADLVAAIDEPVSLWPQQRRLFPCGFEMQIAPGYEAQIRPRSGLALKHGITVVNAPGTIDSDYRGEVGVALINLGTEPYLIEPGMRIAQMVIAKAERSEFMAVAMLDDTERGAGGFGSTGA